METCLVCPLSFYIYFYLRLCINVSAISCLSCISINLTLVYYLRLSQYFLYTGGEDVIQGLIFNSKSDAEDKFTSMGLEYLRSTSFFLFMRFFILFVFFNVAFKSTDTHFYMTIFEDIQGLLVKMVGVDKHTSYPLNWRSIVK